MVKNIAELNDLELNALVTDLVGAKDAAYQERNMVLAMFSRLAIAHGLTVGRWYHEGEEDGWGWIVSVFLPNGWSDWHIHDRELSWFEHLPIIDREWENYSTEEKYQRVLVAEFEKS
jgi:hypothetical protein